MKLFFDIVKKSTTRLLLLLCVIGLIGVSSCEKDEPEPVPPTPVPTPTPTPTPVPVPDPEVLAYDSIKVVSYKINKPNFAEEIEASLEVTFSNPTFVTDVVPKLDGEGVNRLIDYEMSADNLSVTIKLDYIYHMGDRKFGFAIKSKDVKGGRIWVNDVEFVTYDREYRFEGYTETVLTDYDRETMWVVTKVPNRIYRISMSDPEHLIYKDFDLCPNVIAMNPYNGKLYVGSTVMTYDEAKIYDRKVHVLNSTTLETEETIVVSFDHQTMTPGDRTFKFPDASPMSMAFTNDGFGIIVRQNYGDSGTGLCYIDTKNGNKVTIDNCWEEFYSTVDATYDGKQLILKRDKYMSSDLYFVSRENKTPKEFVVAQQYKSDDPSAGGSLMAYKFHRSEPKYLIHDVSTMCMIDYETDTYSPVVTMVGDVEIIDYDYNNDGFAFKIDAFNKAYYYIDLNTGKAVYGCRFVQAEEYGDIVKYMLHNPKRDELLFFEMPIDHSPFTNLIVFDAKECRSMVSER